MQCVIDYKIVGDFVKTVVKNKTWAIKKIINNDIYYTDRAICLLQHDRFWCRVEIYNNKNNIVRIYALDAQDFIIFEFAYEHNNIMQIAQDLDKQFCEIDV